MKDQFGREITYLRISVTDKCNFRCKYCMAADEDDFLSELLSFDEIVDITEIFAAKGINKVRITGGEPLVRPDIEKLIARINAIDGIDDIGITTNGSLLLPKIDTLKKAGLKRINFSLDTMNRDKFTEITRRGEIDSTINAINKAIEMGFIVKINVVVIGGFNDSEIEDFINLTKDNDIEVRFIELMPIGIAADWDQKSFVSTESLIKDYRLEEVSSDGVARLYQIPGFKGKIGLISPMSCKFCSTCNRMRLTADGKLKPCLHSFDEINLKGLSYEEIDKAIESAIFNKPRAHNLNEEKSHSLRNMNKIGG